ncbi:hypothetical protein [Nocardia jiangxiensis]|uniref:hypothetical protein n=1 Tax=Nocardia jiangxiensis TaxID=282685 RepID=UPI000592CE4C|nr:hypothetical protein [Nocardia jiangxiensis]
MVAERLYGYMQPSLLRYSWREAHERIGQVATELDNQVRQVFIEPAPPVDVLWSLLVGVDRCLGGQMMPRFANLAEQRGVDVQRLLESGRRSVRAVAWQALLAELRRVGGGSVIVPGPEHLDGLAHSRSSLLQQLSRMQPVVRVLCWHEDRPPAIEAAGPQTEMISILVGEFRVKAFASALEVASLKAWWYLSQAGLSYLLADAETVLRELMGRRISAEPQDVLDEIRVRLLRTAHTLVIDVHESENHTEEPVPAVLHQRCSWVTRRNSATGGTVTWCVLPLADSDTSSLPDAPHGRRQVPERPCARGDLR